LVGLTMLWFFFADEFGKAATKIKSTVSGAAQASESALAAGQTAPAPDERTQGGNRRPSMLAASNLVNTISTDESKEKARKSLKFKMLFVWGIDFLLFLPVLFSVFQVLHNGKWYLTNFAIFIGELTTIGRIGVVLFLLSLGVNLEILRLFIHFKEVNGWPLTDAQKRLSERVLDDMHFDIIVAGMLVNACILSVPLQITKNYDSTQCKFLGGGDVVDTGQPSPFSFSQSYDDDQWNSQSSNDDGWTRAMAHEDDDDLETVDRFSSDTDDFSSGNNNNQTLDFGFDDMFSNMDESDLMALFGMTEPPECPSGLENFLSVVGLTMDMLLFLTCFKNYKYVYPTVLTIAGALLIGAIESQKPFLEIVTKVEWTTPIRVFQSVISFVCITRQCYAMCSGCKTWCNGYGLGLQIVGFFTGVALNFLGPLCLAMMDSSKACTFTDSCLGHMIFKINKALDMIGKGQTIGPELEQELGDDDEEAALKPKNIPPNPPPMEGAADGGKEGATASGFKFTSNEQLKEAAREWVGDKSKAKEKYGHISDWDVSEVTSMEKLFYANTSNGGDERMKDFNEDLSQWNTGKVENTDRMFCKASSFKSDLTGWETSKCQGNMKYMFKDASSMPQKFKPKGAD